MVVPPLPVPHRTLVLGPGSRLASLATVLSALRADDPSLSLKTLSDVDALLERLPERGAALIDTDELALEDLGIVRRFAKRRPAWLLFLTGADPGGQCARRLASVSARWIAWPIDMDQVAELLAAAPTSHAQLPQRVDAPPEPGADPDPVPPPTGGEAVDAQEDEEDELATVESILRNMPLSDPPAPRPVDEDEDELEPLDEEIDIAGEGFQLEPEEYAAFLEPFPEADDPGAQPPGAAPGGEHGAQAAQPLPGFFKDQVADLADIAQRIDLSLESLQQKRAAGGLEANAEQTERGLADLGHDVARLLQFTRTLGYLAAPPSDGDQDIELSTLLEEMLGGLAGGPGAPRLLFRGEPGVIVRSNKGLLVQAFDALVQVAQACAGEADVVRVAVRAADEENGTPQAQVSVRFPRGVLGDLELERIPEPYALRRVLPHIGANALGAAAGILRGQGGALSLEAPAPDSLCWTATLPRASQNGV